MSDQQENDRTYWREWKTPACIVAVGAALLSYEIYQGQVIESRFQAADLRMVGFDEKLDRHTSSLSDRVTEVTQRIDRLLDKQAEIAVDVSVAKRDIAHIRDKVNGVADKLKVSSRAPFEGVPSDVPVVQNENETPSGNVDEDSDIVFVPPKGGAISDRIGAGTR